MIGLQGSKVWMALSYPRYISFKREKSIGYMRHRTHLDAFTSPSVAPDASRFPWIGLKSRPRTGPLCALCLMMDASLPPPSMMILGSHISNPPFSIPPARIPRGCLEFSWSRPHAIRLNLERCFGWDFEREGKAATPTPTHHPTAIIPKPPSLPPSISISLFTLWQH